MDEELLKLQEQFQAVQMQDAAAKLSERVCVEIVIKLLETKRVDLIFSTSGREYVTPKQLQREIEDEVLSHGGRVGVTELQPALGVDMSHIEPRVTQLVASRPRWMLVSGQIVTGYHLDGLMEEANELLQDRGKLTLSELAQKFSLPLDVLREAAAHHVGAGLIQGTLQSDALYTSTFVERHRARVRGAFSAVTAPATTRSLVQQYGFLDTLAYKQLRELAEGGALAGTVQGSEARSSFHPALHTQNQEAGVRSFYQDNGFVPYSTLRQLSISGKPEKYLGRLFEGGLYLSTCFLGDVAAGTAVAQAEECAAAGTCVDLAPLLPATLSDADVAKVAEHAAKNAAGKVQPAAGHYLVPQALVDDLAERLRPRAEQLALQAAEAGGAADAAAGGDGADAPAPSSSPAPAAAAAPAAAKAAKGGKAKGRGKKRGKKSRKDDDDWGDDSDDAAAAKAAAPEKMSKKAKRKAKEAAAREAAAAAAAGAAPAASSAAAAASSGKGKGAARRAAAAVVLTRARVVAWVAEAAGELQVPDDAALHEALAERLHPALSRALREAKKSVATGGASDKRKRHEALAAQVQEIADSVTLFYKGSLTLAAANVFEAVADDDDDGGGEEAKLAPAVQQVQQHLLRTLGARALDLLLEVEAADGGLKNADGTEAAPGPGGAFSDAERRGLLKQLGTRSAAILSELHGALTQASAMRFVDLLPRAADACGVRVRACDKKKERQMVFSMRRDMQTQLAVEERPEVAVQYAVLIVHSQARGAMLHAKGRSTADIVRSLRGAVTDEAHDTLLAAATAAREHLAARRAGDSPEALETAAAALAESAAAVKAIGADPKAVLAA